MNGAPITAIHGAPVRALIPGYYGTNSVKWVRRLIVAAGRPAGLFASVMYNDPIVVDGAIERRQAGPVAVNSIVTSHDQGARLPAGEHVLEGWAWGDLELSHVAIQVDDGAVVPAVLGPREDFAWQRFSGTVTLTQPGAHSIFVRATDSAGHSQPDDIHINQVFQLSVHVSGSPSP
jgi:DMSO/TMAO reductase YedYZ molybdopterin-dependent catalytic subunit